MKKNQHHFITRLVFGVPALIVMCFLLIIVLLISEERFGEILKKTGEKFLHR